MTPPSPPPRINEHPIPLPKVLLANKTTESLESALQDLVLEDGESRVSTDSSDFPDGDARAWITVLGAFAALFCSFGHLSSFGTYQAWYGSHQFHDLPPSTIAWIGSLQLFIFFLSVNAYFLCCFLTIHPVRMTQGAPIGRIFDAHGQLGLIGTGTVILVTSTVLTSVSTRFYQFILFQGVYFSIGVGMLYSLHVLSSPGSRTHDSLSLAFTRPWPASPPTSQRIGRRRLG